jgi:hypothetical protein
MMKVMKVSESSQNVIPPEILAKCDAPDQAQAFDKLFRSVMAVPKAAIERAEAKWKRKQAKKKLASGS